MKTSSGKVSEHSLFLNEMIVGEELKIIFWFSLSLAVNISGYFIVLDVFMLHRGTAKISKEGDEFFLGTRV